MSLLIHCIATEKYSLNLSTRNQPGIDLDGSRFANVYTALVNRIGLVDSDAYIGDMGQIANRQYVCNAINRYKSTNYQPVSGTATQAANCEYLLKMIDKANRNATTYGTGAYATKQVVDTVGAEFTVKLIMASIREIPFYKILSR
jgi:hypothetical protein